MAFFTIHPAERLSVPLASLLRALGPPAVRARRNYRAMLATAGFVSIVEEDVTAVYRTTVLGWHEHSDRWAGELIEREGVEGFEARQAKRQAVLSAIDTGALRRSLFIAVRPAKPERSSPRSAPQTIETK